MRKDDPVSLRKQLLQMRLELNRQKIRHESIQLLEPVEKFRSYKKRFMSGANPLLAVAGVGLASFLIARKRRSVSSLLPVMRIAATLMPLFIGKATSDTATEKPEKKYKPY